MKYLIFISFPVPFLMIALSLYLVNIGYMLFLIPLAIGIWDAYCRMLDFKQSRTKLKRSLTVINLYKHSMCQRHSLLIAALSVGKFNLVNKRLRELGYRWYHVFPDEGLMSTKFWKAFFKLR